MKYLFPVITALAVLSLVAISVQDAEASPFDNTISVIVQALNYQTDVIEDRIAGLSDQIEAQNLEIAELKQLIIELQDPQKVVCDEPCHKVPYDPNLEWNIEENKPQ
jgi:hypothetical protein